MTAEPAPIISDFDCTTYIGDSLTVLRSLPDQSVQMCVTSPPYFGLRNYQVEGQIGLEGTLDQYVANLVEVFREVHRVLRDDGVLFLNLGDSYATDHKQKRSGGQRGLHMKIEGAESAREGRPTPTGLKPKDLCMVPARIALALQEPYYTGRIKDEKDRIWLAAMIDGEGCIHIHRRKAGDSSYSKFRKVDGTDTEYKRKQDTYGVMVSINNVNKEIIDRCEQIVGQGSRYAHEAGAGKQKRRQTLFAWSITGQQSRALLREVYPHLIAKKRQARIAIASASSGEEAVRAHTAIKALHNGQETDFDCPSPKIMWEKGWFLRSDIVWAKNNGMPESVTDRPTHSHEFIFMLSKSHTYFFDNEAVKEPAVEGTDMGVLRSQKAADGQGPTDRASIYKRLEKLSDTRKGNPSGMRNMRSVWHIPTGSYPDAHFAVFPKEIPRRCIKAGSKVGDVVLDPFAGSGTVGQVARELNRRSILIELNPSYVEQIKKRTQQLSLLS